MNLSRRETLVLATAATAATLAGIGGAQAQNAAVDVNALMAPTSLPDWILGNPDAPVTVVEYASPTCPHCAEFHTTIFPELKARYIDTGKVRFILRPFMRRGGDGNIIELLDTVVFMIARAGGPEYYNDIISAFFANYDTWLQATDRKAAMLQIASQFGFTQETLDQALTNQEVLNGLVEVRDRAFNDLAVAGTPTFYVNGQQPASPTLEGLAALIDPLVPADFSYSGPTGGAPLDGAAAATAPANAAGAPANTAAPASTTEAPANTATTPANTAAAPENATTPSN